MELCQQFRATADRPARPHASAPSAAAPENKAAPPRQKQGAPKPHHHFTTMDTSMTFDNAAPCATRCNFCSQCVHYRTNVRIQRRRERQARDRQRGIAPPPPPPPEPAPSPAKRARTNSQEPFVDVLLAAARDPLAVPQSAPARLATPFFSDAAMAPPPPRASGASVFAASSARRDLARDGRGERRREGAQERRFGGFARAE